MLRSRLLHSRGIYARVITPPKRLLSTAECLRNVEMFDGGPGGVNAFVVAKSQADIQTSPSGPLSGIALAVKDNICTSDLPTTCSSNALKDFHPPYESTAVSLLREAGADIIGKTNCDEFGMGSLNVYSSHGSVVNPFAADSSIDWKAREQRSAGGSSGGSAAAVAQNMCYAALGTDTGGSVRLPASYCGVAGLKPSYGLISRWGVVSYADSLDCVGILARDVSRIRRVFDVVSTHDAKDPTSIAPDLRSAARSHSQERIDQLQQNASASPLSGLRVGIPKEYFPSELDEKVKQRFQHTVSLLRRLGANVRSISLPSTQYALSAYYVIASAEASSNLARYDSIQYGSHTPSPKTTPLASVAEGYARTRSAAFGPEVLRRILLGTYALTADAFDNYFLQAQRVRNLVRADFDSVFLAPNVLNTTDNLTSSNSRNESSRIAQTIASRLTNGVDLIIHPSAIQSAPLLDSSSSSTNSPSAQENAESLNSYLQDVLTVPASLAGIPSLSVPMTSTPDVAGRGKKEWPVGISISGQWGSENLVMHVGEALEAIAAHEV
ncbi:amidase signature enzyme [Clavulina sp. PMI_390]|nr:amidase signature enzyme [Clavulina sp. PMI_390]